MDYQPLVGTYQKQQHCCCVSWYVHLSLLVVDLYLINGTAVDAVVDTAAQVTLLSDDFARKLDPPVIFTDSVLLKGAGTRL
jgi:hypothetical protein